MSQVFDKYEKLGAYHYGWYDDPNYTWYKECVDRCVEFCKGSTLDVGCGDGLLLSKLPKYSFGVDNNDKAIEICESKKLVAFKLDMNPTDTIQIAGGYDYVACLNTIEHLKSTFLLKDMIEQAAKGAIIITDKATENKGRYHEHEFTKKELLDLFKDYKTKYFEINSTEHGKPITFIGVEVYK